MDPRPSAAVGRFRRPIADGIDSGVLRTVACEGDCFFAVLLAMTIPYHVIML